MAVLRRRSIARRGSSLIEFALVSLVLTLLLTGVIELGRALFVAQGLQDAARVAAREIALTPLPADATFQDGVAQVYSAEWLVVDLDLVPGGQPPLEFVVENAPLLNRALAPYMIREDVDVGGTPHRLLRYPGALLDAPGAAGGALGTNPGLTVGVPFLTYDAGGQEETLRWLPVVEELVEDVFPLGGGGRVELRINYPFQAAAMTFHGPGADPTGPFDPTLGQPVIADDSVLIEDATGRPGGLLTGVDTTSGSTAYSGVYGLGRLPALGQEVRPFRRVLTGQAIFRREVFSAP